MGITQPLAVDNEHTLVDAFENEFVPAYYLFDRNHELVHRQAGDRGFERLEAKIEEVLSPRAAAGADEGRLLRGSVPRLLPSVYAYARACPRARVAELVDALA